MTTSDQSRRSSAPSEKVSLPPALSLPKVFAPLPQTWQKLLALLPHRGHSALWHQGLPRHLLLCLLCFLDYDDISNQIDFIICLGGDGTLLYASSLFPVSCAGFRPQRHMRRQFPREAFHPFLDLVA